MTDRAFFANGHWWPCTRYYVTAPATDLCTCGEDDEPSGSGS